MTQPVIRVGVLAPDFQLACTRAPGHDRDVATLADYRGRWLCLLFYPRDFSLVCPTELTGMSNRLDEFQQHGCEVLGISTDAVATHERWIATPRSQGGLGGLRFPLASDVAGTVCKDYGVFVEFQNVALRGLFIIDPNGVLQYQVVHNMSVGRRTEEVLRVLQGLQSGGLCPENWSPEQPVIDPLATLGPGSVVSTFRIEKLLGSGSFASVYRARDAVLDRVVALKVLSANGHVKPDAMLREARAAAALSHPNVCTVYTVDHNEGVPLIAMEYVDGYSLSRALEKGKLDEAVVRSHARQIAQGLAAAHAAAIVHGDLKPANLMVRSDGIIKIMDFGLARRDAQVQPTAATMEFTEAANLGVSGTPSYMSPEQARGQPLTTASDVFSFGLILYEMLAGKRALSGSNVLEVLRAVERVDANRLAARVPEPFAGVLRQVLVVDPTLRRLTLRQVDEILA